MQRSLWKDMPILFIFSDTEKYVYNYDILILDPAFPQSSLQHIVHVQYIV